MSQAPTRLRFTSELNAYTTPFTSSLNLRPVVETLLISQSGFALYLDDVSRTLRFGFTAYRSMAFDNMTDEQQHQQLLHPPLCISIEQNVKNDLHEIEQSSEFNQIRIRLIMADNIREAYLAAVRAYYPDRAKNDELASLLEYPFWSMDSVFYSADDDEDIKVKSSGAIIHNNVAHRPKPLSALHNSTIEDFIGSLRAHGFTQYHLIYDQLKQSQPQKQASPLAGLQALLSKMEEQNCPECRLMIQSKQPSYTFENMDEMSVMDYTIDELLGSNETVLLSHQSFGGFITKQLDCSNAQVKICLNLIREAGNDEEELFRKYPSFLTTHWLLKSYSQAKHYQKVDKKQLLVLGTDAAYKAQALPVLVQLTGAYKVHGETKADGQLLRRILVEAQITSLAGYPYIQPHNLRQGLDEKPEYEWYARWVEAMTFLPSMSIPAPPWYYSETNATRLVHKYSDLHQRIAMPLIRKLMKNWVERGEPVIRPLWYAEPEDSECFKVIHPKTKNALLDCDTQFMVGPDLVVAPIVQIGQISRNVYLPRGCWNAGLENDTQPYMGHKTYQIKAGIETLIWFMRNANYSITCS